MKKHVRMLKNFCVQMWISGAFRSVKFLLSIVYLLEVHSFKTKLFNVYNMFIAQMTSNPIYFCQLSLNLIIYIFVKILWRQYSSLKYFLCILELAIIHEPGKLWSEWDLFQISETEEKLKILLYVFQL